MIKVKKHKVIISPVAEIDIWESVHYISANLGNPVAAQRMLDSIEKYYGLLEQTPRMGTEYITTSGAVYRYVIVGKYMLFYTIEDIDEGTDIVIRRFLFAPSNIGVRLDWGFPS